MGLLNIRRFGTQGCALGFRVTPPWATPLSILDTAKRGDSDVAEVVRLRMSRVKDRILTNSATKILNGVAPWG